MRWYPDAVGGDGRVADHVQRTRLLDYKEDDERATMTLRPWMSSTAVNEIPHAGDLPLSRPPS
jgi:predicted RecB family nuclease